MLINNVKRYHIEEIMIRIKLAELLGKHKMTRKHLSELTGIRPNTICDLYNENVKKLDIETLNRICTVLQCQISEILEFQQTQGEKNE